MEPGTMNHLMLEAAAGLHDGLPRFYRAPASNERCTPAGDIDAAAKDRALHVRRILTAAIDGNRVDLGPTWGRSAMRTSQLTSGVASARPVCIDLRIGRLSDDSGNRPALRHCPTILTSFVSM